MIVVAGNKIDLESMRVIELEDAEAYCKEQRVKHFEVSAKLGKGIKELFEFLTRSIYEVQNDLKPTGSDYFHHKNKKQSRISLSNQ